MRILLLLSAFLAALSGGVAHARIAGPVVEVSASASMAADRYDRTAPAVRISRVWLEAKRFELPRAQIAPASRQPIYADRLRI